MDTSIPLRLVSITAMDAYKPTTFESLASPDHGARGRLIEEDDFPLTDGFEAPPTQFPLPPVTNV